MTYHESDVDEMLVVDRRRARYHEVDAQGIVFNSRYLEYVDVAMAEWFRSLGWDYPSLVAAGCDPSLVSVAIDWSSSARLDEELVTSVQVAALGRSSFTLAFRIESVAQPRLIAAARVVYVNFDPHENKSRPLPTTVRERMNIHLVKEPADGIS